MAQILWKDGVEPPDVAVGKSKNGSIATYTGSGDEAWKKWRTREGQRTRSPN